MSETGDANRSHVVEDQSAVFAFLARPETHGLTAPVVRIDTHGAVVFLAGADAYKVKRAVRFPFMDYSTLEKRRAACEAEVAINGPEAPGLYLGTVAITRGTGDLSLGGDGPVVDWAVHMRRFDESRTLDRVAAAEGLSPELLRHLVDAILAAHGRAPLRDGEAATRSLERYLDQNESAFAENADVFPADRARRLVARSREEIGGIRALLVARGDAGFVRRCHGDLHLRNVVLLDGHPTLFDAIEFDDAIATGDVLYDLAFLLMDLVERGFRAEANLVLNRYLSLGDPAHLAGLRALPLFLSIRATIRAKVTAASVPNLPEAARPAAIRDAVRYFGVAEAALERPQPRLLAIGGLSGSGKSTLAARLAPAIGGLVGAVHLRSDVIRKRLAGVAETERLPADHYTQAASDAVYDVLRSQARAALAAGATVIVDAVHARPAERDAIEALSGPAGAAFLGLWLDAPESVLARRVTARTGDASDADASVVSRQITYDIGPLGWPRLDASGAPDMLLSAALAHLDQPTP